MLPNIAIRDETLIHIRNFHIKYDSTFKNCLSVWSVVVLSLPSHLLHPFWPSFLPSLLEKASIGAHISQLKYKFNEIKTSSSSPLIGYWTKVKVQISDTVRSCRFLVASEWYDTRPYQIKADSSSYKSYWISIPFTSHDS